jgi:hypothetical protein
VTSVGVRSATALKASEQVSKLLTATDEGRRDAAGMPRFLLAEADEPPGGHRLGLSLERERRDRLGPHGLADEAVGGLAEEDLPGLGRLLEASGDVDSVPCRERLTLRGVSRYNLARIDAGADTDPNPPVALEGLLECARLVRGARSPPARLGGRRPRAAAGSRTRP